MNQSISLEQVQRNTLTMAITFNETEMEEWESFLLKEDSKAFCRDCSGYWLFGAAYDKYLGWLVCEDDGHELRDLSTAEDPPEREEYEQILHDWKSGNELPDGWFRLDAEMARNAWIEGVRLNGEGWYGQSDSSVFDAVLQRAILGEVRYG